MIYPQDIQANLSLTAYVKINLHAAKHPGHVMGYLVGKAELKAGGKSKGGDVDISDVLPICHSSPVGPIFETAGRMCQSYFPDEDIIGVYYMPDQSYGNSNKDIPVVLNSLCEVIKGNNKSKLAMVLTVDTNKINPNSDAEDVDSDDDPRNILTTDAFLHLSRTSSSSGSSSGGNRQRLNSEANLESGRVIISPRDGRSGTVYNDTLDKMLASMSHLSLIDFQDHMDSDRGEMDPRNRGLNVLIN